MKTNNINFEEIHERAHLKIWEMINDLNVDDEFKIELREQLETLVKSRVNIALLQVIRDARFRMMDWNNSL